MVLTVPLLMVFMFYLSKYQMKGWLKTFDKYLENKLINLKKEYENETNKKEQLQRQGN